LAQIIILYFVAFGRYGAAFEDHQILYHRVIFTIFFICIYCCILIRHHSVPKLAPGIMFARRPRNYSRQCVTDDFQQQQQQSRRDARNLLKLLWLVKKRPCMPDQTFLQNRKPLLNLVRFVKKKYAHSHFHWRLREIIFLLIKIRRSKL
jgi:hypothetical protein